MAPPSDRKYTSQHEWLEIDKGVATVGVTAYAADALGDVVYVELPTVASTLIKGEVCGEIESTKSVSDLFAPADGEVLEINQEIVDDPSAVNIDPYGKGWLFRMRLTGDIDLIDATSYQELISGP